MEYYPTILTLHVIFAGIWLSNTLASPLLKKFVLNNKQKSGEKKFIIMQLTLVNLFGMTGAIGILITGILMTSLNPGYGFFQFGANHWLAAKQVIMVVILLVIFVLIIPRAKKLRAAIGNDLESSAPISKEGYENLIKLGKLGMIVGLLVVINFLLAITHPFFG